MEDPSTSDPTAPLVPSELRRRVESTCSEARVQRARSVVADASLREARHAATSAHAALDAALATLDERRLAEHKDQARRSYRLALTVARDAAARQRAAATWLRRIDDLNRSSRGALGEVLLLRARCETLDQAVRDATMASNIQRVRTEAAEARLHRGTPAAGRAGPLGRGSGRRRGRARGLGRRGTRQTLRCRMGATRGPSVPGRRTALAIELLLAGDANATRQLARQMADLTGQQPSRCLLLLQVLAETIVDLGHRARPPAVRPDPPAVGTAERDRGARADRRAARPGLPVRPG